MAQAFVTAAGEGLLSTAYGSRLALMAGEMRASGIVHCVDGLYDVRARRTVRQGPLRPTNDGRFSSGVSSAEGTASAWLGISG